MRGTEQQFQQGLVRQVGWRGNLVTILHSSLPPPPIRRFAMLALVMLILLGVSSGVLADAPSNVTNAQVPSIMEKRGLPVEGVTLIATLQQNAVASGDQVMLNLTTRNEGLATQQLTSSSAFYDFNVIVQNEQGQLMPIKVFKLEDRVITRMITISLPPNMEYSTPYLLSYVYTFAKVGRYRITAMSDIFNPDVKHITKVISNTVLLTVTDHLAKDITLTSALTKPIVAIDKPIALTMTLKNTAKTSKTLTAKDLTDDYTFTVQDFRGEVLLPTNKAKADVDEKAVDRVLQPDETIVTNIDIAKRYDLHKEGRYFITASHNVTDDEGQLTQVYSNTAVLTVTKTPPPEADMHMPLLPIMKKRGLPVEGIEITATLAKADVPPGSLVEINTIVQNTSNKERICYQAGSTGNNTVLIQDEQGRLLKMISKQFDDEILSSNFSILPANSKQFFNGRRLTDVYEFKNIGNYNITVRFIIFCPELKKFCEVVSNSVLLHITDKESKDFTLTPSLANPLVATGRPIPLNLTLTNASVTDKTLTAKNLSDGYTLTVQDFRGEIILPVKKDKASGDNKASQRVLQPDESITTGFEMSKLYDLHKEGRYFINASYNVTDDKGQEMQVYSKTIILNISNNAPLEADKNQPTTTPVR